MNINQTQKAPSKKAFLLPAVAAVFVIGMLGTVVAIGIIVHQIHVDGTISEAVSSVDTSVTLTGYPGETLEQNITISNAASVDLNVSLDWTEDSNVDGVIYTTNLPATVSLVPGDNVIALRWAIDNGSPAGQFPNGTVNITRI